MTFFTTLSFTFNVVKHLMHLKILYIIFTSLILFNCSSNNDFSVQEFGFIKHLEENLSVEINLDNYKSMQDLSDRASQITCNDSISKIKITKSKIQKTLYFYNPCYEGIGCILIKSKNIIEISNDTIFKNWKTFPLDSLENILKKDYFNNGKNSELSDAPNRLLIKISSHPYRSDKLKNTIDKLTDIYLKISDTTDIKIWLRQKLKPLPPPPPVTKIDVFEIINSKNKMNTTKN